jgi:hypothetical protein
MPDTVTHYFKHGTFVTTLGHGHEETARDLNCLRSQHPIKSVNVLPTIAWCQLNMADDIDLRQGNISCLAGTKEPRALRKPTFISLQN